MKKTLGMKFRSTFRDTEVALDSMPGPSRKFIAANKSIKTVRPFSKPGSESMQRNDSQTEIDCKNKTTTTTTTLAEEKTYGKANKPRPNRRERHKQRRKTGGKQLLIERDWSRPSGRENSNAIGRLVGRRPTRSFPFERTRGIDTDASKRAHPFNASFIGLQ